MGQKGTQNVQFGAGGALLRTPSCPSPTPKKHRKKKRKKFHSLIEKDFTLTTTQIFIVNAKRESLGPIFTPFSPCSVVGNGTHESNWQNGGLPNAYRCCCCLQII